MVDKKRIAFFIPRLSGGGAERVFLNLANYMSGLENISVYLFVCKMGGPYEKHIVKDVTLVDLGGVRLGSSFIPLVKNINKYNISILVSALPVPNGIACLVKLCKPKLKVILTEHNDIRVLLEGNDVEWRKKIVPSIVRILYHLSDDIVCVSSGVKEFIQSVSPKLSSKLSVIYNPVFDQSIIELSKENVSEVSFPDKPLKIVTVGRLTPQKNIELLIHAVYILKQKKHAVILYILGDGELRGSLEELVIKYSLVDCVNFLGFQDNPYKFMARADVFVLASLWEGFGNVLVEAAACEIKLVSMDCPSGPREIFKHLGVGNLVSDFTPEALAQGIVYEYENGSLADLKLLDKFSIEEISSSYLTLME